MIAKTPGQSVVLAAGVSCEVGITAGVEDATATLVLARPVQLRVSDRLNCR
jgi:hypothetical protein